MLLYLLNGGKAVFGLADDLEARHRIKCVANRVPKELVIVGQYNANDVYQGASLF